MRPKSKSEPSPTVSSATKMNYRETLDYLYSRLPYFTRIGKAAYKANLDNIINLCSSLGNPEKNFPSIHIAGTNGKGSVSHFIASIFQEAGYKTGLFTSPHLKDFRERIKVNGKMISRKTVVQFTGRNREIFEKLNPSFFEMNVALAFDYFSKQKVDIAIIETGLGGRLDSTNIIQPLCSVITNIGYDHMDLLGNTLVKIASEKAGIIKSEIPVIISQHQNETDFVFTEKASKTNSKIFFADEIITIKQNHESDAKKYHAENPLAAIQAKANVSFPPGKNPEINICSPLAGNYQFKNLKAVIMCALIMKDKGWKISIPSIEKGIRNVVKNTGLRGRWEIIGKKPLIVCDTGHNKDGVKEVINQAVNLSFQKLHIVWGMNADKDVEEILGILPKQAEYYFCRANLPRAMDERLLQAKGSIAGLHGKAYKKVREALNAAKKKAGKKDLILVGGSTFIVAEAL